MSDHPLRLPFKVAVVFLATVALGGFLIYLNERNHVLRGQQAAIEIAATHGRLLQEQLNRSLSATYALAAVLRQGRGEIDNFDALATEMLGLYGGVSALQLAPGGVIARIVPLAGNEAAMGHNLLLDPLRSKEAIAAVETKRLTLAGPFVLRQGGLAVVGRLPVYFPAGEGGERFWGFTTAVIRIVDLLAASELNAGADSEYDYELWRLHPDSGQRHVFAASSPLPLEDTVSFPIEVPNGKWTLSMARTGGWHSSSARLAGEAAVVLFVGALAALLAFHIFRQPQVLRREVELRTRELSESNSRLAAEIVERQYAEDALRESESQLERRVEERTAELSAANAALHEERARQQALIRELGEARSQLLQSEKMAAIGQLAAGMAHEINNPISFVQSNLKSLRHYADDLLALLAAYESAADALLAARPEARAGVEAAKDKADLDYLREDLPRLLAETEEGAARVRRIVQDLRGFSHVDESGWQFADLRQELDSTLGVIAHTFGERVAVVKEYGPIPRVECIPSRLNQVFMNLLLNAAHAIEGEGVITIRTESEGERIRIDIEDSGKGIAPENLHRIFEPFYTTRPVGQGRGLGLSLSYGIVKQHGGDIEVESEPGKGSRFHIRLPLTRR